MTWSETYHDTIRSAAKAAEYLRCVGAVSWPAAARRVEELKAMGLVGFIAETRAEFVRLGLKPPPVEEGGAT